jgi:hypothetical protein
MVHNRDVADQRVPKSRCGRSLARVSISSPNKEFAQANHERVNLEGSSFQKLSCMNPVPAEDLLSSSRHCTISLSLELVNACMITEIGQILPMPVCGDPIPAPAVPFAKYGLSGLRMNLRVLM